MHISPTGAGLLLVEALEGGVPIAETNDAGRSSAGLRVHAGPDTSILCVPSSSSSAFFSLPIVPSRPLQ